MLIVPVGARRQSNRPTNQPTNQPNQNRTSTAFAMYRGGNSHQAKRKSPGTQRPDVQAESKRRKVGDGLQDARNKAREEAMRRQRERVAELQRKKGCGGSTGSSATQRQPATFTTSREKRIYTTGTPNKSSAQKPNARQSNQVRAQALARAHQRLQQRKKPNSDSINSETFEAFLDARDRNRDSKGAKEDEEEEKDEDSDQYTDNYVDSEEDGVVGSSQTQKMATLSKRPRDRSRSRIQKQGGLTAAPKPSTNPQASAQPSMFATVGINAIKLVLCVAIIAVAVQIYKDATVTVPFPAPSPSTGRTHSSDSENTDTKADDTEQATKQRKKPPKHQGGSRGGPPSGGDASFNSNCELNLYILKEIRELDHGKKEADKLMLAWKDDDSNSVTPICQVSERHFKLVALCPCPRSTLSLFFQ